MRFDSGRYLPPLLLLVLAGFAWLTHHPETSLLRRAQEIPILGRLAAEFQARYLPPEADPGTVVESARTPGLEHQPLVNDRRTPSAEVRESVWVLPGAPIRQAPEADAEALAVLPAIANLPLLERRGDWLRVRRDSTEGWVYQPESDEPPLGSEPEPPRPLPGRRPDPQRLAAARGFLADGGRAASLGPYTCYTDHRDPDLLEYLSRIAAQIEPLYQRRFRREPVGRAAEAVVLFNREEDYLAYRDGDPALAGIESTGQAGHGLVVLFVGGRSREEIAATLVHELTHLLNRRALGPALPPWLDEGMATELAFSGIDEEGRLDPSLLGGSTLRIGNRVELHGALAALIHLAEGLEQGLVLPLPSLMDLDLERFVERPRQSLHYTQSAFWIRYLLEGEAGSMAPAFQRFLGSVAEGQAPTAAELQRHLDWGWERLEVGFRVWVRIKADLSWPLVPNLQELANSEPDS